MRGAWAWVGLMVTGVALSGTGRAAGPEESLRLATTGESRMSEGWWKTRHEAKLKAPERANARLVFLGDSITHGWENGGKAVWKETYAPLGALDLGYSADRTEHVIWRLENGELDGLSPDAVIVMIGTNNTGHRKDSPEAIAAGVRKICELIQAKLPKTRILLLGIFPRGATVKDALRVNNAKADELVAKLADNKTIFFASLNDAFLAADGTLSNDIMPDLLHPNARGYQIWADAMAPHLKKVLNK